MTTDKIFDMLFTSVLHVRGEAIADALGITRTAVNKHIKKLQSQGINIDATRRGYKYINSDTLTSITLSSRIAALKLPINVIVSEVESTNNSVKALISNNEVTDKNILFVAPKQFRGKGRLGREFDSSEGGVYMTLCYNPHNLAVSDSLKIVLLTGLCVTRVLDKYVPNVTIKWPNDVFIGNKKVSGILLESVVNEFIAENIILGIGINVSNVLGDHLSNIATSLSAQGVEVYREDIIVQVTEMVFRELAVYEKTGFDTFIGEYIKRSRTIGNVVTVSSQNGSITGKAVGLSEEGNLLIDNNGKIEKIIVGDVEA